MVSSPYEGFAWTIFFALLAQNVSLCLFAFVINAPLPVLAFVFIDIFITLMAAEYLRRMRVIEVKGG